MAKNKKTKSGSFLKRYDREILVDLAVRAVLAVFFAFSAGIYCKNAFAQLQHIDLTHISLEAVMQGLSILAGALYTLMIACLYVLRHRPLARKSGVMPTLSALLGGFLMFALLWFKPDMELPLYVRTIACALAFSGSLLAFYVLTHLGRSFSILPESRELVTKGPYNYIRHPLYVAEAVSSLGQMILFFSPGAVAVLVAQIFFQLVRIRYEEQILSETFPEYKKYAKRTSRLIPGIY